MIDQKIIFIFIVSSIFTFISIFILRPFFNKLGIVDKPSKRKEHYGNIPLVGGLSIFIGICFSLLGDLISNTTLIIFMITAFFILILGFIDDCYPLSPKVRLLVQIIIASFFVGLTEIKFDTFGHSFGLDSNIQLGLFSYPITILGIVLLTNAFNLMDGLDGVAGSLAIISIIGIKIATVFSSTYYINLLCVAVVGALLPYMWFNLVKSNKQKIFLGDCGSLFLGYSIAFILLHESNLNNDLSPSYALWLIAVPVFDIISVMIYRLKNSRSLFTPDRSHLHQFLKSFGLSDIKVLLTITFLAIFFVYFGLLLEYQFKILGFPFYLLLFFIYLWLRVFSKYSKFNS